MANRPKKNALSKPATLAAILGLITAVVTLLTVIFPHIFLPPQLSQPSNNTNQAPVVIGVVGVGNLKELPVLDISDLSHPKLIETSRQKNSTETLAHKNESANNVQGTPSIVNYLPPTRSVNKFSTVFNGLDIAQSGGFIPADVQLAVGGRHIVEMVNLAGQMWTKSNLSPLRTTFPLNEFFKTGNDMISSPRVVYDNGTERWFAAIQDITTNSIQLAVSSTNDPQGNWAVYSFRFSECPDDPSIAISNDKLIISANDFKNHCEGTFSGVQFTVVDKNDLLTAYPTPRYWLSNANKTDFSVHPVRLLDAGSDLYMVSTGSGGSSLVKLYSISGRVPFIGMNITAIPINFITPPPQAPQPNTTTLLDTGDGRILDAVMYKRKLWFTSADACLLHPDNHVHSCFVLVQIDVKNNKIIQDFDVGAPGEYIYHPALTIDTNSNLYVIYGVISDKLYPSIFLSGQSLNGPLNTLTHKPVGLFMGAASNENGRQGGYILSNDPSNPVQLWVAGEYYNPKISNSTVRNLWSTFIGNYITSSSPTNVIS